MPENPARTPDATIAGHLTAMADDIERFGLWTDGPNFVDASSERLDVPAAAYKATVGSLPFLFAIPTQDAAETAQAYIESVPAAMDVLHAIAAHMAATWPDLDWTDDPIDRLSNWPSLLGVTPEEIPRTLLNLADTLTAAPAAA